MEVSIFKEITTEGVISSIEENSKKYHVGFYGDMNNPPERKLIKGSAAEIGYMIKELEVARIRITKAHTLAVNKEHKSILDRLKAANEPFTVLIDEYNAQRKRELAILKACEDAKQTAVQLEFDHEFALLMNSTFEHDKTEELRLKQEQEKKAIIDRNAYAAEQVMLAEAAQESMVAYNKQVALNEENARLANKKHVQGVKTEIYKVLIQHGLSENDAKTVIHLATIKELPNLTINY